jgi:ABC-type transport system substrate-binding protein
VAGLIKLSGRPGQMAPVVLLSAGVNPFDLAAVSAVVIRISAPIIDYYNRDSSSFSIENALAFSWTVMPPWLISIGKMSVWTFFLRIFATQM